MFLDLSPVETVYFIMFAMPAALFTGYFVDRATGRFAFGGYGNASILFSGLCAGLFFLEDAPGGVVSRDSLIPLAVSLAFVLLFGLAAIKKMLRLY